jgi:hypothetical protein
MYASAQIECRRRLRLSSYESRSSSSRIGLQLKPQPMPAAALFGSTAMGRHSVDNQERKHMKTFDWLTLALAGGLAWAVTSIVVSEARKRRTEKELEDDVQRWEQEGGHIPGVTVSAETAR